MLSQEQWLGILRHLATAVGGYLTGVGILDDATAQTVIGSVVTLAGVFFSVLVKR